MNPEKMNSILSIILSLVPFIAVGGWLAYKTTKSKRPHANNGKGIIKVGDKNYRVKKATRILVVETKTGRQAIVSTCGYEDEIKPLDGELTTLPEGIKVRYRLDNGIFSPEETDWRAGNEFSFIEVTQVEEYEQV